MPPPGGGGLGARAPRSRYAPWMSQDRLLGGSRRDRLRLARVPRPRGSHSISRPHCAPCGHTQPARPQSCPPPARARSRSTDTDICPALPERYSKWLRAETKIRTTVGARSIDSLDELRDYEEERRKSLCEELFSETIIIVVVVIIIIIEEQEEQSQRRRRQRPLALGEAPFTNL